MLSFLLAGLFVGRMSRANEVAEDGQQGLGLKFRVGDVGFKGEWQKI